MPTEGVSTSKTKRTRRRSQSQAAGGHVVFEFAGVSGVGQEALFLLGGKPLEWKAVDANIQKTAQHPAHQEGTEQQPAPQEALREPQC